MKYEILYLPIVAVYDVKFCIIYNKKILEYNNMELKFSLNNQYN